MTDEAIEAPKPKAFTANIDAVKKALGKSAENLNIALNGKVLAIEYPSLAVCSELSQQHHTALEKLGTIVSSEQVIVAAPVAPKHEHLEQNALVGPQRVTVRFL